MTTLFVNACMRGEASRTLALLPRIPGALRRRHWRLTLRRSISSRSTPIVWRTVRRSRGQGSGTIPFSAYRASSRKPTTSSSVCRTGIFRFPAAFKTYLEHVSVCELTFHYTEGRALRGHLQSEAHHVHHHVRRLRRGANFGYEYIVGIAKMFGILKSASWRPRGAGHRGHRRPGADGQGSRPDGETRLSESGKPIGGPTVSRRSRFSHPEGFDDGLSIIAVSIMVQRALNCVDPRLVDHGLRVAAVLDAMLEAKGVTDPTQRRAAVPSWRCCTIVGLSHGEIDRMVAFGNGKRVRGTSFYGYLFFKELTPLGAYADRDPVPPPALRSVHRTKIRTRKILAGAVHVADRVDVLLLERPQADVVEVERLLAASRPGAFSPGAVALFFEAQRRFDVLARLRSGVKQPDRSHIVDDPDGTGSASSFLDMLVHIIDFRSRHTVTHTVTTAWVAYELALRLIGDHARLLAICTRARLVHDMGKIGIPSPFWRSRGSLDDEEMKVMRTHVELTEDILEGCTEPVLLQAAARHHEKLDGSGYPRGLHAAMSVPDRISRGRHRERARGHA